MQEFNFDTVASDFKNHLSGQLPWYNVFLSGMVKEIGRFFIRQNSLVYDFGSSTGNVHCEIKEILEQRKAKFLPYEKNEKMIKNYQIKNYPVINKDFTDEALDSFSFALCILSLSFVHPYKRKNFIAELLSKCEPGGAVLILEKFENKAGLIGTIFNRITWANKLQSKEPLDQIINKEIGLSGVQFPLSQEDVTQFDLVFAYGDFKAFLYIKK